MADQTTLFKSSSRPSEYKLAPRNSSVLVNGYYCSMIRPRVSIEKSPSFHFSDSSPLVGVEPLPVAQINSSFYKNLCE